MELIGIIEKALKEMQISIEPKVSEEHGWSVLNYSYLNTWIRYEIFFGVKEVCNIGDERALEDGESLCLIYEENSSNSVRIRYGIFDINSQYLRDRFFSISNKAVFEESSFLFALKKKLKKELKNIKNKKNQQTIILEKPWKIEDFTRGFGLTYKLPLQRKDELFKFIVSYIRRIPPTPYSSFYQNTVSFLHNHHDS